MRKSFNVGNDPILVFKIEVPVTLLTFAHRLAYAAFEGKIINWNNKRHVIELLKGELVRYGRDSNELDRWDGASEEFWKPYQDTHDKAMTWIPKNYPHLK